MKRIQTNSKAFKSGEKARRCGFARLSPFTDVISDEFFFAGFDGIPWTMAIRGER